MAEGIFKAKIEALGLNEQFNGDSAGTSTYHLGSQPDRRTLDTLKSHGITLHHSARQILPTDADQFKYILAMDQYNYFDLKNILPNDYANLYLMRNFDEFDEGADVPDPYYGNATDFENVFQILDRSMNKFIEFLRQNHASG